MPRGWSALCVLLLSGGLVWAQFSAGDVAVVAYSSDTPDGFAWVALRDVPSNTVIRFTDSSVSNNYFRWSEHLSAVQGGPLSWSHTALLERGTVVRYDGSARAWNTGAASGTPPQLGVSGDQLFAYTGTIAYAASQPANYQGNAAGAKMLFGLNFGNGGWSGAGGTSVSAVPSGLSSAGLTAVHVNDRDNGYYAGGLTGSVQQIRQALATPANWVTSDGYLSPSLWPGRFEVLPGTALFEFGGQSGLTGEGMPVVENFDARNAGPLNGQGCWTGIPLYGAQVQGTTVYAGPRAAILARDAVMAQPVAEQATNVWIDFYARVDPRTPSQTPRLAADSVAGFYVDANSRLVAYSNATWVTLSGATLPDNAWRRLTVHLDYGARRWELFAAGSTPNELSTLVAGNLAFAAGTTNAVFFHGFKAKN